MEPSYFDGIDNVYIHFNDKDGLYEGGQPLAGQIKILVKSITRIKSIKLYISSRMRIKWIDVEGGSTITYEELDFPLNETITIREANKQDPYSQWMYPGEQSFKFSFKLPKELPYSLDGSKYGSIYYKAKAVVLIANGKTSESMDEDFFIRSRPPKMEENLIEMAARNLPLQNVEYGDIGGGCFSKPSHVEILVKLTKSVYKQGEKIRPEVELTLEKGSVSVPGLMVLLVQEMLYTCNLGEEDERMKKEVQVMDEWSSDTITEAGGSNSFSDVELMIAKDIPVSGFPHCDLIDVGYYIHAVAKTPKRDDDVCVKLPITILFGEEKDWSEEERSRMIGDKGAFGKNDDFDAVNDANGEDVEVNDGNDETENVPTETITDFENESNLNTDVDGDGNDEEQNNAEEAADMDDQVNDDTINEMDDAEAEDDMM